MNFKFINILVTDGFGIVSQQAIPQLYAARFVGCIPNILIVPSTGYSPIVQVNDLMAKIPSSLFGKIRIVLTSEI
jgi:hypothetical protein